MGSYADDILSIAEDGRYRPETRGRRIGYALGLDDDEVDALEQAFVEQHEWTIDRLSDDEEEEDTGISDEALALLAERSKNWIQQDETDIQAMLRLILASPSFDPSRQEKKFIKDKISRIQDLLDDHDIDIQQD